MIEWVTNPEVPALTSHSGLEMTSQAVLEMADLGVQMTDRSALGTNIPTIRLPGGHRRVLPGAPVDPGMILLTMIIRRVPIVTPQQQRPLLRHDTQPNLQISRRMASLDDSEMKSRDVPLIDRSAPERTNLAALETSQDAPMMGLPGDLVNQEMSPPKVLTATPLGLQGLL